MTTTVAVQSVQNYILETNNQSEADNVSFMAGVLMGCKHEFRIGPNANYKAHMQTLRSHSLLDHLSERFSFARPKEPFLSIGRLVEFCDLDSIESLAVPGKIGKTLYCEYWSASQEGKSGYIKFYENWIVNIKRFLIERNMYSHPYFLSGLLHRIIDSSDKLCDLYFAASVKATDGSICSTFSNGLQLMTREDKSSDRILVKGDLVVSVPLTQTKATKWGFVVADQVYIIDGTTLQKILKNEMKIDTSRASDVTLDVQKLIDAEEKGNGEVFVVPNVCREI